MRLPCLIGASLVVLTGAALPLAAQDRALNFALRGGAAVAPAYPGASSYDLGPDLGLTFGALTWGAFKIGSGVDQQGPNGVSVRGAFRLIGDRKAGDNPELAGLQDVDTAVELGLGVSYQQTHWRAFGELRKGVTGHSGITGTLGLDALLQPGSRWRISAGPRVSFGDDGYAQTYFGVPTATANFAAFDAAGGALGAGFEVRAVYDLHGDWALDGALGYERLLGAAGDSPITAAGSRDQWSLRIGLRREFTLRF